MPALLQSAFFFLLDENLNYVSMMCLCKSNVNVKIWEDMMKSFEMRGKILLDANVLTPSDLCDWLKAKNSSQETIVGIGLPSYSSLQFLLTTIKAGAGGLLLTDGTEITHLNRPQDRLLDWFFHPVMVLKEQIKVINLADSEVKFLEKTILFGSNTERMEAWDNGSMVPQDTLRAAQILAISRRYDELLSSF